MENIKHLSINCSRQSSPVFVRKEEKIGFSIDEDSSKTIEEIYKKINSLIN